MKRDIKRENEIIREIVEHVKQFYLWKIDNYDNYNEFYRNVYNEINDDSYNYFYDDNQKDPVMGVFCKYMTETFKNGSYPWFAEKDRKRIALRHVFCRSVLRMAKRNKRKPERIIARVLP